MTKFENIHRLSSETSAIVGAIRNVTGDTFSIGEIAKAASVGHLSEDKLLARIRTAIEHVAKVDRVQWEIVRGTRTWRKLTEPGKCDRVEKKVGFVRRAIRRTLGEARRVNVAELPDAKRTEFLAHTAAIGTLELVASNDKVAGIVAKLVTPKEPDANVLALFGGK